MDGNLNSNGPYRAALNDDWEGLKQCYSASENCILTLPFALTAAEDTAFHLAVFSGSKDPLEYLLEIGKANPMTEDAYRIKNAYGNTALHEAAANGNLEAVELLVNSCNDLLEDENNDGETPLFRAAAYGRTNVVNFLASRPGQMINKKLKDIHFQKKKSSNEPDASILHVAVQGEHFETALQLLELDKDLATLEDERGMTSLHLLATIPSAFSSGYRMDTLVKRLVYLCIPVGDDEDDGNDVDNQASRYSSKSSRVSKSSCQYFFKGWPILGKIWIAKRKHKLAFKLAKILIAKDTLGMWMQSVEEAILPTSSNDDDKQGTTESSHADEDSEPITLFLATETGILEIVNEILDASPELVEHRNRMNRNILHVAIMHRQKEIFYLVKKMKIPMTRLVRVIDKDGYTILHHAADMGHGNREIHPAGPVYELQEELKWFRRVEKMTPAHYARLKDTRKQKMTCYELFKTTHNDLLNRAQQWIKETSQSCSAVAVLVATVVFAAAYTVPGGSDENGHPVFLNDKFFLVFTVMDVLALASSLTSVVMFLSILTSPFKFEDFHHSLPRKLTLGFTLLFFSLATTMFAFTATILLIIRLQKPRWTTTLIYTAAFLPVSIFALTQFPMYVAFKLTLFKFFKRMTKILPLNRVRMSRPCGIPGQLFKKKGDSRARPPV